MSTATSTRFAPLDATVGSSPELRVDRESEGREIARFILDIGQRVVVLYGGARSGKTEMVKHWIIPALEREREPLGWEVLYGKCDPALPGVLQSRSGTRRLDDLSPKERLIVVLDEFDRVLALPKGERAAACNALFERVAPRDAEHIVVLVTDVRQLTNVYGLSSYDPDIAKAVRELGTATVDGSLQRLSGVAPESAVEYSEDALAALSKDGREIEGRGYEVSFDLIVLVDRYFRDIGKVSQSGRRVIDASDVTRAGGLIGILKGRMQRVIQAVGSGSAERAAVARTLLEDVLSSRGALPDRTDVALRVGVSTDEVNSVIAGLLSSDGLLRQPGSNELALSPPQLGAVLEDEIEADKPFVDQSRRIVDEGLRSWTLLGDLLSGERFDEVHRWRRHLALDDEQCRFLLLSGLRLEDAATASAASTYWLARIEDREDAQDILLSATLDKDPKVRARGAAHLGPFANPDVQSRLTLIALVDDDADVRAKAVAGLEGMKNEVLRRRLVQEINSHGPNRLRAIQVLRVFPDEKTVALLRQIVGDPAADKPIRDAAIAVLSTINTPESVDALIQIALHDVDEDDRASAAIGLSLTRTEERNRQILGTIGPLRRISLVKWGLAAIAVLTLADVLGLAGSLTLFAIGTLLSPAPLMLAVPVVVAWLLWLTSRRLMQVRATVEREGKAKRGVVTVALLVFFAAPLCLVLHGLAHALLQRWRRAASLFAIELLGIFLLWIASAFADVSFGGLQTFYTLMGIVLIGGSYFFDVLPVLADTVFVSRAVEQERRKETIYRHLLSNAEMVTLLLHQLRSGNKAERFAARHLVRRFADRAQPAQLIDFLDTGDPLYTEAATRGFRVTKDHDTVQQLESLWAKANPSLRARIADILSSSPTQSSIEALERVRAELSPWSRLRYSYAKAEFRLRVWPRYLRVIAALSLPALILFTRIGYSALGNSAWSQVVAVDRYLHGAPLDRIQASGSRDVERRMLATITFLARNYPEDVAPSLIEHFSSPRPTAARPRVRATIARGLIVIRLDTGMKQFHEQIKSMDAALLTAILFGDSATFARTTDDLAGVRGTNPVLGSESTSLLQKIILARGPDSAEAWKPRAIRAVGSMHYSFALPVLDGLLTARSEGPLGKVVRTQFGDVITKTLDSARVGRDPAGEAQKLLASLEGLKPTPPQTELVKRFIDSVANAKGSPRNDPVYATIAADPGAEEGYSELLARFDDNRRYRDAVDTFAILKARYPESIWPRRMIAQIEHDKIADPAGAAFQTAYDEMIGLRDLAAYERLRETDREAYTAIAADFVEIALSAKRYNDVERVGESLVADSSLPLDRRLNAALFIYLARVLQQQAAPAADALTRLEGIANEAPANFYNNWVYSGTRAFLMRSGLSPTLRDQLLKLCREQFWYSKAEAAPIFEANRAALARARK